MSTSFEEGGQMEAEPEGFRDFVTAKSGALSRFAWMLTGDSAAAEDLLQTALAKTWPHWRRVASGHPEAYVRKVMLRTNASWHARLWTNEKPTADLTRVGTRPRDHLPDEHARADDRLQLMAALADLPVRQRQVVVLRYFEDLSVESVAEAMGSSTGTVKSQSAKGLLKLRAALSTHDAAKEHR
jgi:RNA polymerase sigma-70 factor (sigma-E family)